MDETLQAAIVGWDVRNWSRAVQYWDEHVDFSRVERGLEIGGREGGLSLWLALKGKQVVCSDIEEYTDQASATHRKFQVDQLVRYERIDAKQIPYENAFDLVMFKSVLGGVAYDGNIESQRTAVAQMHKALRPGGKLLFAENLVASPLHQLGRRKFVRWVNVWRYVTRSEMREFLSPFSRVDMHTTGVLGAFGRKEPMRRRLSAIDAAIANYITPPSWRYIVYGIAQK